MGDLAPRPLIIGISTTALFDLSEADQIFKTQDFAAFAAYQRANKEKIPEPGAAFPLVKALQKLNTETTHRVEFVIVSRNHPRVCQRVSKAITYYDLGITQWAILGGRSVIPYLSAYSIELFLSTSVADVRAALDIDIAAAYVVSVAKKIHLADDDIRIAFDGDCVLFSDEAERITRTRGVGEFVKSERQNALTPLGRGPFASFVQRLAELQAQNCPIKTALVTARGVAAHERAFTTLEAWGIEPNEIHFLGGKPKGSILKAFGPHIYFDDNEDVCKELAGDVIIFRVPTALDSPEVPEYIQVSGNPERQFLLICKMYLKDEYQERSERRLANWYKSNILPLPDKTATILLQEFVDSYQRTPSGDERRAGRRGNTKFSKLVTFLEKSVWKHSATNPK
jgi:5'-nucleotidase